MTRARGSAWTPLLRRAAVILLSASVAGCATAPVEPPNADNVERYLARTAFDCPASGSAVKDTFVTGITQTVRDGAAGIREINREFIDTALARAREPVVYDCIREPQGPLAAAETATTGRRYEVRLGRAFGALLHAHGVAQAPGARVPSGALGRYRNTVLHEFLHTVARGNLAQPIHDSLIASGNRAQDVIYSCAGAVFPGDALDVAQRVEECRTCRLAYADVDHESGDTVLARLRTDEQAIAEATAYCRRFESESPRN